MALRHGRDAGHGRAARGGAGFALLAVAVLVAAAVLAAWPAVKRSGQGYLAGGAPGHGEIAAGDHLQTSWNLWLVGSQLERGAAPWRDPWSFRPETAPRLDPAGWPYGPAFWPLDAALGPVWGWNAFLLLTYVLAGLAAIAWLRELGLPRGPALVGGVAFAIAPYRVEQSAGHLLGPISVLLPVALWAFERGRRGSPWWLVGAGAALASIPLSGQVHLALGAIPFFAAYALVRERSRRILVATGATVAVAAAAGLLVQRAAIAGSIASGGRSLAEVSRYAATWADFLRRSVDDTRSEAFVFVGWVTLVLAVVGLASLAWQRRAGLATVLGLGALLPALLALGTNLPSYGWLWRHVGPFRYPRVPERLMPIACLCLAALVAFAVARLRARWLVALALVAVAADLKVDVYGISAPDRANAAYAALRTGYPGRLLELPVFLPDVHYGSVYMAYAQQAPRQRLFGYSTLAKPPVRDLAHRLERLNCGDWTDGTQTLLARLGVGPIAFHGGLFVANAAVPDTGWFAWRGLLGAGYRPVAQGGPVALFARGAAPARPAPVPEPPRSAPVFCQGWYQHGPRGPMASPHAPLWIHGGGTLRLVVFSYEPLPARIGVDGRTLVRRVVSKPVVLHLPLGAVRWHLVTFDVPHLVETPGRRIGLELVSISASRR